MARPHFVKKAQRAYKNTGIKKGESYWWWKFRFGEKHRSKTQPRPSQLTGSDFLSQLYAIQERIEDLKADEGLADEVSEIAGELRSLGEEQADKRDNMPESLQESETGALLEERASACESVADELEAFDFDYEEADDDDEEAETDPEGREQKYWDEKLEEIRGISLEID